MHLKKIYLFRILAILTLGNIFLAYINAYAHFKYAPSFMLMVAWLVGLAIFHTRILFNKAILFVYIYAIIFTVFMLLGQDEPQPVWKFFIHSLWLFMAIFMYTYFVEVKDYKGLAYVVTFALLFIAFTLITSIIGLFKYPMAARELSGELSRTYQYRLIEFYNKKGIASYDFFTGLAFCLPVLIVRMKMYWATKSRQLAVLGLIILTFYGLFQAKFGAPFLQAIVGSAITMLGLKNAKKSIFVLLLLVVLIFFTSGFLSEIFKNIADSMDSELLKSRIMDVSVALKKGLYGSSTHLSDRADRIPFLFNQILKHNWMGGGENTNHVFWLDTISQYGLIGIFPWILITTNQIVKNIKMFDESYRFYYLLSMVLFISLGFMKNLIGDSIAAFVFFVIPGIYYLKYLEVRKPKKAKVEALPEERFYLPF